MRNRYQFRPLSTALAWRSLQYGRPAAMSAQPQNRNGAAASTACRAAQRRRTARIGLLLRVLRRVRCGDAPHGQRADGRLPLARRALRLCCFDFVRSPSRPSRSSLPITAFLVRPQIFGCTDNAELASNVKTAIGRTIAMALEESWLGTNSDRWQHWNAGQRSIVFVRLEPMDATNTKRQAAGVAHHLLLDGSSRDACRPRTNGRPLPPECRSF
jgi:hypothetical protein